VQQLGGMSAVEEQAPDLSETERAEVEERKHPRAQVLYETIRQEGQHEIERPVAALAWSGLAAGLSMGFSTVAMGMVRAALPEAAWSRLIYTLGYPVGFLIVIIARQQLFTENTLTPVLPLLNNRDRRTLRLVLRLWATVFVTNVIGTVAFAFAISREVFFGAEYQRSFAALSAHAMQGGFVSHFARAILAGWLIALMVWMLAGASHAGAFVIVLVSYVIGIADLTHIIAGATEAFYGVFAGQRTLWECLGRFLVPVALGNMLGGIALVAALSHAQIAADEKA
jgi:formate/nitrite transporter FocA (FNT family)